MLRERTLALTELEELEIVIHHVAGKPLSGHLLRTPAHGRHDARVFVDEAPVVWIFYDTSQN